MKLLVFSDIHTDKVALEKLMAIEADIYVCAGDLVSWARGLDGMAEILKPRAEKMYMLPGNHESEADIADRGALDAVRDPQAVDSHLPLSAEGYGPGWPEAGGAFWQ